MRIPKKKYYRLKSRNSFLKKKLPSAWKKNPLIDLMENGIWSRNPMARIRWNLTSRLCKKIYGIFGNLWMVGRRNRILCIKRTKNRRTLLDQSSTARERAVKSETRTVYAHERSFRSHTYKWTGRPPKRNTLDLEKFTEVYLSDYTIFVCILYFPLFDFRRLSVVLN